MKIFFSFLLFFLAANSSFSQTNKRVEAYNLENGLAIQGFDPVAYFNAGKAIKGKKEFAAKF